MLARFFVLFLSVISLTVLCEPARASEKERQNSVKNLALLMFADWNCPGLRANFTAMTMGMSALGVRIEDYAEGGRYHTLLVSEIKRHTAEAKSMTKESFCHYMEDGFGPDGVVIPGLIKHR